MRRSRFLMMLLAAVLAWWAVRLAPSALALASATVNFGGSLQAGQGTPLLSCTAPANPNPNPMTPGGGTATATATITCTNNMDLDVTVNGALAGLTPSVARPPTITANRTSIPLTKFGGTGTATITITANSTTTKNTYTLHITTSATVTNRLDYSQDHTITFRVQ